MTPMGDALWSLWRSPPPSGLSWPEKKFDKDSPIRRHRRRPRPATRRLQAHPSRRRPRRQVSEYVRHMNKDTAYAVFAPLLIGGMAAAIAYRGVRFRNRAKTWPSTRGIITDSAAVGERSSAVIIRYKYFTSEARIGCCVGPTGILVFDTKRSLERYPKGKEVDVYFDPADPSQCCLEPTDSKMIKAHALLAAICLLFPILYLLWIDYLK